MALNIVQKYNKICIKIRQKLEFMFIGIGLEKYGLIILSIKLKSKQKMFSD